MRYEVRKLNDNLSGNLIIIGGAEDKEGKREILKKVCDSIDKDNDILLIATIATEFPEEAAEKYKKVFSDLKVKNLKVLDISCRKDAFDENNVELINSCSLIFLLEVIN
mgnify:FL=1